MGSDTNSLSFPLMLELGSYLKDILIKRLTCCPQYCEQFTVGSDFKKLLGFQNVTLLISKMLDYNAGRFR